MSHCCRPVPEIHEGETKEEALKKISNKSYPYLLMILPKVYRHITYYNEYKLYRIFLLVPFGCFTNYSALLLTAFHVR